MKPFITKACNVLLYDPPKGGEIDRELARKNIAQAVASCEVWKALATIKATIKVDKMTNIRTE